MVSQYHHQFCVVLLFGAVAFTSIAHAQTFTGTVVGRVVDSQQRAVGNASVILRSAERDFERRTTTNRDGEFAFQLVHPGKFAVTAEASGFAATAINVEVVVAAPLRVDLSLSVQPLQQSVQVLGESGVSVQTESAGLGFTIGPREMSDLPSLTRSPYDFIALMPGANPSNDDLGVGYAVNGGRTQSANYLLDGGENNETFMSAPAQNVPLDSIEEFSVQSNHYSAEYGRNSGFIANVVTKAGTKDFHGSLYDYTRNSALAANTFINNANDLPRPVFNRHQFGGALGGPIRPAKLFFFASMEPILVRSTGPHKYYVPTPQLLAISAPGTQAIFESYPLPGDLSSTDVSQKKVCPYDASCNVETGAGLVTLPAAFAASSRVGPQDAGAGAPQNTILASGRLDWVINSKTQAFVRYALDDFDVFAQAGQPYSSTLDSPYFGRSQSLALNLIHIASPHLAAESRFVYSRFRDENQSAPQPTIPQFYITNEPDVVLPSGTPFTGGPENFYQFFQTLIWNRNRHTLKFGGQFVHIRESLSLGIGVGEVADAPFADVQGFVDGTLDSYRIALDPKGHLPGEYVDPPFGPPSFTRHYRYNDAALFIADTWKITPRLTLTPGLRWEYFGVLHSPGAEHSLDSNFYPGAGRNILEQLANGRFLRTMDAPGDLSGRFYLPDYRNFAPRLGIAYDLFGDGKTVIRAGAGIFYDRRVGWELFRVFLNPPGFSLTRLEGVRVTDKMLADQFAFSNDSVRLSRSVAQPIDTNLRTAYALSWNATIEREVAGAFVLGASYLGSSGNRLYSVNNVNRLGSGGLLHPNCIRTRIAADGRTSLGPDFTGCPRLNTNVANIGIRGNGGHSSFAGLQLRLDSRRLLRWGAQFGVNYAWSHSIDSRSVSGLSDSIAETGGGSLAAFQPGLDRGSSDFDVRHRIAAHWIWEIPLGRAVQDWKSRYLLGGWEISGLLSYQTGQPFTIADSGVPDWTGERMRPRVTGTLRSAASLVPDATSPNTFLYVPLNQVYDPATDICMANSAPFACEISVNGPFDGTLPRNTYRAPGTYYQNTALMKDFSLPREEMKLQLRAEFYNLFNHPNLYVNGPTAFTQGSTDVNVASFARTPGQERVPGVTARFKDSRQIVLALRFNF